MRIPYPSHSSNIAGHHERLGHCSIQHWSDIPLPLLGHGINSFIIPYLTPFLNIRNQFNSCSSNYTSCILLWVWEWSDYDHGFCKILLQNMCCHSVFNPRSNIMNYYDILYFLILTYIYIYVHFFFEDEVTHTVWVWYHLTRGYYLQGTILILGNNPHTICRLLLPAENKREPKRNVATGETSVRQCLSPCQILTIDGNTSSNTPKKFMETMPNTLQNHTTDDFLDPLKLGGLTHLRAAAADGAEAAREPRCLGVPWRQAGQKFRSRLGIFWWICVWLFTGLWEFVGINMGSILSSIWLSTTIDSDILMHRTIRTVTVNKV